MKKLLLVLVMLFAFSFVACDSAETYDYNVDIDNLETDLQGQINSLELQIGLLQDRIDNIIAVEGINGNTVYYENQVRMLAETVSLLQDTFDETLAPTYMKDVAGNYVDFDTLAIALKTKYFDVTYTSLSGFGDDQATTIPFATLVYIFEDTEITLDDVIARMILLAEELSNYDYYVLSSNGIKLAVHYSDGSHSHQILLVIPTTVLINDMFTINYNSIIGQQFEITLDAINDYDIIDYVKVQIYYDAYVLAGTYDGYVLNYIE